jgi:tetratricopeptide (TPR) repeat protein
VSAVAHETGLEDRNRQELEALCRMLTRARGFRLGFAVANHPSLRERLAAQCRAACGVEPILEVTLDPDHPQGIVAQLEQAVGEDRPAAMFVHGLQSMLDLRVRQSPAMDLLNLNRDYCWRRFPWPVVFVAPLFAVREFARQAPDFWSGYSGLYHFVGDREDVQQTLSSLEVDLDWSLERRSKLERREILEQVRTELEEREDEDPAIKAELLSLLARAAAFESDLATQERFLTESLAVYDAIGDRLGQATSIRSLGDVAYARARYDEAAERYEQALVVYDAIGDRLGQATSIQSLGDVARMRARYDEAAERYEQALARYREIGDRYNEAYGLAARARLALATGDQGGAVRDMAEAVRILTAINLPERAEQLRQEATGWNATGVVSPS